MSDEVMAQRAEAKERRPLSDTLILAAATLLPDHKVSEGDWPCIGLSDKTIDRVVYIARQLRDRADQELDKALTHTGQDVDVKGQSTDTVCQKLTAAASLVQEVAKVLRVPVGPQHPRPCRHGWGSGE